MSIFVAENDFKFYYHSLQYFKVLINLEGRKVILIFHSEALMLFFTLGEKVVRNELETILIVKEHSDDTGILLWICMLYAC